MKYVLPFLFMGITSGLMAQVELYGPVAPSTGGVTAQDFESTYDQYDALVADDFIVPTGVTWYIDSIVLPGSYSSGAATTCGLAYNVHADNSGEPGTQLFGDTINSDLDENGDGDLVLRFETPVSVTAGHYWFVANGRKNFASGGGQWYWQRDVNSQGYPALWKNPGNGFGSGCTNWTTFYDCTPLSMADSGITFYVYGCYGPTKPLGGGFDTLLCAGAFNSVTLNADTVGSQANVSYLWSTGATTASITVSASGAYTLYAEDSITLCGYTATYNIGIGSVPEPDIEDDTLCGSSSIPATYGPIGGCQDCVTMWSDGSTGAYFSTFDPGQIIVTILDTVSGCSSSDTAFLTVIPAEATINPGSIIDLCEGTTETVSVAETLTSYSWTFSADGTNWSALGTNATADVTAAGYVAVSGVNDQGCTVYDTAAVILREAPDPELTATAQSNGSVDVSVSGTYSSYFWDDGSIGQTINVNQNGIYTVTVTDEFGCEGSAFINIFNVGIEDAIMGEMSLYPNPANDELTIEWPATWVGNSAVTVYDLQGREVSTYKAAQQLMKLDLSDVAPGNYVLKVITPEGIGTSSLVIAR